MKKHVQGKDREQVQPLAETRKIQLEGSVSANGFLASHFQLFAFLERLLILKTTLG